MLFCNMGSELLKVNFRREIVFPYPVLKMRVLLISPPFISENDRPQLFPSIGLGYIGAVCLRDGHETSVLDAALSGGPVRTGPGRYWIGKTYSEIESAVRAFKPDVVGIACVFSIRVPFVLEIARIVKKTDPGIRTVLGGIHPSLMPAEMLGHQAVDFVVIGEGEESFARLLRELGGGRNNFKDIDGLAYRENGAVIVQAKTSYISDLDALPYPARHLFDLERYFKNRKDRWGLSKPRQLPMITSRSCPFRCSFCAVHAVHGSTWRPRSPESVVGEIERLIKDYGVTGISFEDDNIAFDKPRMLKICELIVRRNLKFSWNMPNGIWVDNLDEEVLSAMKKAGCVSVNLPVESGDEYILHKVIRKPLSLEKARRVAAICRKLGISANAYFVLGMPGESEETLANSLAFMKTLDIDNIAAFVATPFPGTEMFRECVEKGYLRKADYDDAMNRSETGLFGTPLFETPSLTKKRLLAWVFRFYQESYLLQWKRDPVKFTLRDPKQGLKTAVLFALGIERGYALFSLLKKVKARLFR